MEIGKVKTKVDTHNLTVEVEIEKPFGYFEWRLHVGSLLMWCAARVLNMNVEVKTKATRLERVLQGKCPDCSTQLYDPSVTGNSNLRECSKCGIMFTIPSGVN